MIMQLIDKGAKLARMSLLIGNLHPSYRKKVLNTASKLATQLMNPQKYKRDFLLDLYHERGWIEDGDFNHLKLKSPELALADLEKICKENARLRNSDEDVPCYPLPDSRELLDDLIRDSLRENGIDATGLKVRCMGLPRYLKYAISTGNDRSSPNIHDYGNYGWGGEELSMLVSGIVDARDTTYLHELAGWKSYVERKKSAVLIYSPDAVSEISPLGLGQGLCGFHAFHFGGDIKKRSLLAVFTRGI